MPDNPLLDFAGLPRFGEIRAEHILPAVDTLIAEARAAVDRVADDTSPATWQSVVAPTEAAFDHLDRAWGAVRHLNAVVSTAAIRDAYNAALPRITAFHADMPEVARTLAIPRELRQQGIERYGFHGLSCESIVRQRPAGFVPSGRQALRRAPPRPIARAGAAS
jgi:Zn-dependent oligopeptidase